MAVPSKPNNKRKGHTLKRNTVHLVLLVSIVTLISILQYSFYQWGGKKHATHQLILTRGKDTVSMNQQDVLSVSERSQCIEAVKRLIKMSVGLLAIDFDQTIIEIHTFGQWTGTAKQLASYVRPELRCIISEANKAKLPTVVASFSRQKELMEQVVQEIVPKTLNASIKVYEGDDTRHHGNLGKASQIKRALDDLNRTGTSLVQKRGVVLIDDDAKNIELAKREGVVAILFKPDEPGKIFQAITNLESS